MALKPSIITRDTDKIAAKTGNIYKSIFIASKRAKQIAVKTKDELTSKLAEFASTEDNLEEIFENREQIEISKFYERQAKAPTVALDEFMNDEVVHRDKNEEIKEEEF